MKKLLKKFKKLFKNKKGFTLIELLVVIGILGILAAALIATIDPFEQLNKAQDANVKNTLTEFINANIRYYTTHSALPWNDANNSNAVGCTNLAGGVMGAGGTDLYSAVPCLQAMVADSEIKASFTTVANILKQINIHGTATDVTACFTPVSKSGRNASDVTWNSTGTATGLNCPANGGVGTCYWCSE
jgi:prepilin-type N-terminal cleavage/methylation domain-containing protein